MTPFFSIIVPCCDVEPYVCECLDSMLNQPFTDWECLIGVETSKDKTEEIVREYAAKDARFKVFTGPRSGSCSASRNTGIDMATGEYVIFLDGDDTIVEGSLQRLHDKIAARPGADRYSCAMLVYEDKTGLELERRDNYPSDFSGELTGPSAILAFGHFWQQHFCPMLQLAVFRRLFLQERHLRCIHGLRCQDSEFTPRAIYLSKRIIPLHEMFYLYRVRAESIQTSAKGAGYFLKDWAIIFRSLLAFHNSVVRDQDFDRRITKYWCQQWITGIFSFWFDKRSLRDIPRQNRVETIKLLFSNGYGDLVALLDGSSIKRKFAALWMVAFAELPPLRWCAEQFFVRLYIPLTKLKGEK